MNFMGIGVKEYLLMVGAMVLVAIVLSLAKSWALGLGLTTELYDDYSVGLISGLAAGFVASIIVSKFK